MQADVSRLKSISSSSSLEHASQLMVTSSGTEVGVEVEEEEVEYVEEIVEYEEEEEEDVEGEVEQQDEATEPEQAPVDATAKPEAKPSDVKSSVDESDKREEEEEEDAPQVPPSSSAQDLSIDLPKSTAPLQPAARKSGDSAGSLADSQSEATTQSGPNQTAGAGVDLDFKQLEAQAAKVAKEVSQVALDVSSKLTAGLRSAFGGAEQASSGAGASLTKLAGGLTGGLSSWWGSLDPAPQPVRDETAELVASSNKASGELQQLFGLSAEENLVEHFKCKLLQTYSCNHNAHTPAIQLAFQGTLYVTDRHTCYCVEERGRKAPFKVPHNQVIKATRQRPARKGDLSDVLKLELSNGQWLAFKDFESGSALDSALALVEHLTEGA